MNPTETALIALQRENSICFPGRVRSILRSGLSRAETVAQLSEVLKIHRENVRRCVTEPAFAAWIVEGRQVA